MVVLLGYTFCFQKSFRKQQSYSQPAVIRVYIGVSHVAFWIEAQFNAVEYLELLRVIQSSAWFSLKILILYEALWKVYWLLSFYSFCLGFLNVG